MRDPQRIQRICAALSKCWWLEPDQRLGQFLMNLARLPDGTIRDIFLIEDDEWLELLQKYLIAQSGSSS